MPAYRTVENIQLGDVEFWKQPLSEIDRAFAALREESRRGGGLCFHEEVTPMGSDTPGPGYWSAVTFDDVRTVNRDQQVFSSASGVISGDADPDYLAVGSIIVMDNPRHHQLRSLVSKAFTPRTLARAEASIRDRARRLIDTARETGGSCDFVSSFAAPLPLQVICDMLGIPEEDEAQVFHWTNVLLGIGDTEMVTSAADLTTVATEFLGYAARLGVERAEHPGDDLSSLLMQAEVDGERLTPFDFAAFVVLLSIAGNETTRHGLSWGMHLLTEHPDQRALLTENYDELAPRAVEEIVRWASPILHMRRKALTDTVVGDTKIAAGDKVVMWYWSANRDEDVFADGHRFDIARPNAGEMVGFGGGGTHYCLGASLARREMAIMFDEILHGLPDLQITAAPNRLQANFVNGIKSMPCEFTVG
ncbi:cytochrome P450 [Sporichthya brevicatena]|uniref:Cytochrome P450 n=1 Tax=Sporichthya brevicatena TaxID=171442 RepID=A0ABP3SJ43_9ACTN